jgi:hypothetical protein
MPIELQTLYCAVLFPNTSWPYEVQVCWVMASAWSLFSIPTYDNSIESIVRDLYKGQIENYGYTS